MLKFQIITDPPILFCDEPTTGLDSFHASSVVTLLRELSGRGKMVVCTIHQPASDVFTKFDQLSLLAPGGRLAYHGDAAGAQMHFYRSVSLESVPPGRTNIKWLIPISKDLWHLVFSSSNIFEVYKPWHKPRLTKPLCLANSAERKSTSDKGTTQMSSKFLPKTYHIPTSSYMTIMGCCAVMRDLLVMSPG